MLGSKCPVPYRLHQVGQSKGEIEMKYMVRQSLFTLLLLSFLAANVNASEQKEYIVNKVCNTQPNLTMTKIVITEDETLVTFVYKNGGSKTQDIGILPPGHKEAFYITKIDKTKKFHLLDISGISIWPSKSKIKSGESIEYTLTFERIDDSMKRLHLIEGEIADQTSTYWHFLNVKLK